MSDEKVRRADGGAGPPEMYLAHNLGDKVMRLGTNEFYTVPRSSEFRQRPPQGVTANYVLKYLKISSETY